MTTLLANLVDGASGDSVTVSSLLRKVKVLASRLQTAGLADWVDHELVGYPDDVELPDYRGPFPVEAKGHFSGPFNSGCRNAPIPAVGFPAAFRDGQLFTIQFTQAISELQRLAESTTPLEAEWPADAVAYTNALIQRGEVNLYKHMWLQQAWRQVSPAHLTAIIDTVRGRILDLSLSLEKVSPSAGQPDGDVPSRDVISQIVTNVYGGTPNIAVASHGVHQQVGLPAVGDTTALFNALSELGVSSVDIADLEQAIQADQRDPTVPSDGMGSRVSAWLGRFTARAAGAAGAVGVGAAGELVARVVAAYFGLT